MADVTQPIDEKAIFLVALELDPEDRDPFLLGACPEPEFRERIERLIQIHERGLAGDMCPVGASEGVGSRFGEFELRRELGRGGVGVVHLAWDSVLHREVALKVLGDHVRLSADAMRQLRDEARLGAAMRHPSVVPVHRFGTQGDTCYIVTEYVNGPTLRARIDAARFESKQPAEWTAWCARTAASVADALDHCHRAGVIHRDLKPSNILLDPDSGPRITDFGIASSHQMVRDSVLLAGSCHYLSPERISDPNIKPDPRSDVYALGVTLFEMLTLKKPFDGKTEDVLRSIVTSEAPDPRRIGGDIPHDLATICLTCMASDPQRRYQTAAHVAADLRCFLERRPIMARPATARYRLTRWTQRNRALVATAGVATLAAIALASGYQVRRDYRNSVAWITVETSEPSVAFIQGYDPNSFEPTSPKQIGSLPLSELSLPRGHYRLTLVRNRDDALAELDLCLTKLGWRHVSRIREVEGSTATPFGEAEIGFTFSVRGDLPEMILVEGGRFNLAYGNSQLPWHKNGLEVRPFLIDRCEVTNHEYKRFMEATGASAPVSWRYVMDLSEIDDKPVVGLRVDEAMAYARWVGKRLPTALEWQAASRGHDGWAHPGGNKPQLAEIPRRLARPTYQQMMDSYLGQVHRADKAEPWDPVAGPINMFANVQEYTSSVNIDAGETVVMGASWADPLDEITLASHVMMPTFGNNARIGFRCAKSLGPPAIPSAAASRQHSEGEQ